MVWTLCVTSPATIEHVGRAEAGIALFILVFCVKCGFAHMYAYMEACEKNTANVSTLTGKKACKSVAKALSKDSSPRESVFQSLSSLSLEEWAKQVLTDIATIKLENRVAELEAE